MKNVSDKCCRENQNKLFIFNTFFIVLVWDNVNKYCKAKVKCTLVQALRLCTGRTAHRGSRGIALPFHDHGNRRGWEVCVTPRPLFTPEKDPVPIVQEAEWTPGPVWTDAENLAATGIRSPDRPARSQSLCVSVCCEINVWLTVTTGKDHLISWNIFVETASDLTALKYEA